MFALAVAGETGVGKSTLMETLFKSAFDGEFVYCLCINVNTTVATNSVILIGCGRYCT